MDNEEGNLCMEAGSYGKSPYPTLNFLVKLKLFYNIKLNAYTFDSDSFRQGILDLYYRCYETLGLFIYLVTMILRSIQRNTVNKLCIRFLKIHIIK